MADAGLVTPEAAAGHDGGGSDGRRRAGQRIHRGRGLPGGRAVVGALLVSASAVGVFAAYLSATAAPDTRYAVAIEDVEVGTRLTSEQAVARHWEFVPIELPEELARSAVAEEQASQLVGRLIAAPVRAGDLLQASVVVDDAGVPETEKLSFSVPLADAVGGTLQPGERIDVLATFGGGTDAWTEFVVRGALLVDVHTPQGAVAGGEETTLTVALSSLEDVQALAHAVRVAEVVVTRSTVGEGSGEAAPGAYRPDPERAGPTPDPTGAPADDRAGNG